MTTVETILRNYLMMSTNIKIVHHLMLLVLAAAQMVLVELEISERTTIVITEIRLPSWAWRDHAA
jgi:hypothetical protein